MSALWGGIEAGGTKFICAMGRNPQDIPTQTTFLTTTPEQTLQQAIDFFRHSQRQYGPLQAIGIACFGPLDVRPDSPTYGYITATPKPGWSYCDIRGTIQKALDVPVSIDTDVNGAALGEWRWGAAQGLDTFIYLTVGTGIGGGGLVNGKLMHGLVHPEMGHILIPHDRLADPFEGVCPYHGDCLEGLASGPAIEKRWGCRGELLPPDHPAWALEAHYLAMAVMNFILTLSPQRIIMGGGVMQQAQLLPLIRSQVRSLLNHYVASPQVQEKIDEYILPAGLGAQAGILGALALAYQASA